MFMYKKLKLIALITLSFCLNIDKVLASPPAPSPRCYIEGTIQEVTHLDASNESRSGGPTDMANDAPDRYSLRILINKTTYVDGETSFQSCDSLYKVGAVHEIIIIKDKIVNNSIPVAKQKIIGTVHSFWWPSFDSYVLTSTNNSVSLIEKIKVFISQISQYFRF